MQFLKTLFWALLVGVVVAFALNNVTVVSLQLWGSLYADVNLPFLLLVVFLAGFVPPYILYRTTRWRMRQRMAAADRALADLRVPAPAAGPVAGDVIVAPDAGPLADPAPAPPLPPPPPARPA